MKDLQSFLGEEDEKKSKPQPKKAKAPKKKAKERKQSKGKDDARYVSLMDEYKRLRRYNRADANKIHHKALQLKISGDVSKDAITAGQYI